MDKMGNKMLLHAMNEMYNIFTDNKDRAIWTVCSVRVHKELLGEDE